MLINDFFEIVEITSSENKLISMIRLNSNHKIYSGHFPNNPVTPGLVQVQIVKEILEFIYHKDLRLISMSRCKFMKILNPIETPFVTVDISVTPNPLQVSVIGKEREIIYFKFSAVFSDETCSN